MEVIADGKIVWSTMEELNLTEDWLIRKLRKKEIEAVNDVFYARNYSNGSLYITVRDKDI